MAHNEGQSAISTSNTPTTIAQPTTTAVSATSESTIPKLLPSTTTKKRPAEEEIAEQERTSKTPFSDITNGAGAGAAGTGGQHLIELAVRSSSPVKRRIVPMTSDKGQEGEQEDNMDNGEQTNEASASPPRSPQNVAAASTGPTAAGIDTTTCPPKKKQKLSPASKEAKEKERQLRELQKAQKAQEKVKREEERRKREEERKQREEAKEQKRRAKEEERIAREEEKKRKEKSQMRLNAFFAKPKTSTQENKDHATSSVSEAPSTTKADEPQSLTDYELEFRPFFLQSHTTILPIHRFQRSEAATKDAIDGLDSALGQQSSLSQPPTSSSISNLKSSCKILSMKPRPRQLYNTRKYAVKEIVHMLYNPATWRTESTSSIESSGVKPEDLIKRIPMKTLQFAEDVRPPYQGTFTRPMSLSDAISLARNPFKRSIPNINYDYDSEAEWDDPEEGEDLDSDDGDEEMDEEDEDLDGFLDDGEDEGAQGVRKKVVVGDLEPVSSGLIFEGVNDVDGSGLKQFGLEVIGDDLQLPIDPFSTAYWETPALITEQQADEKDSRKTSGSRTSAKPAFTTLTASVPLAGSKTKREFPPEQLEEFKEVIRGSNLTKAGLTEVLKKRFPKVSKETIKDTLSTIAVRHGAREIDKKWVLI